uniref:AlNc14C27G2632 protein n=1 Tax=Albugo laibachii Nc14 TaxID=890382 RepID=F0W6Z9_9STRA|nr:AlNc14C27G2632 [Albugo laibachii Nc14]|eukprot:CCA16894.1 AlNc14C27G2632 [Albugo laibachii Nc14]
MSHSFLRDNRTDILSLTFQNSLSYSHYLGTINGMGYVSIRRLAMTAAMSLNSSRQHSASALQWSHFEKIDNAITVFENNVQTLLKEYPQISSDSIVASKTSDPPESCAQKAERCFRNWGVHRKQYKKTSYQSTKLSYEGNKRYQSESDVTDNITLIVHMYSNLEKATVEMYVLIALSNCRYAELCLLRIIPGYKAFRINFELQAEEEMAVDLQNTEEGSSSSKRTRTEDHSSAQQSAPVGLSSLIPIYEKDIEPFL